MMSFETFLNLSYGIPLEVDVYGKTIRLKNLNEHTWLELQELIDKLTSPTESRRHINLLFGTDIVKDMSSNQVTKVVEAWQEHSGITFTQIAAVYSVIDELPNALEYDLRRLMGINGIRGLLTDLKPVEAFMAVNRLINEREAWLFTEHHNLKYPWPVHNQLIADLVELTIRVNSKNPNNPVDYDRMPIKKQQSGLGPIEPEEITMTQEEIDSYLDEDIIDHG